MPPSARRRVSYTLELRVVAENCVRKMKLSIRNVMFATAIFLFTALGENNTSGLYLKSCQMDSHCPGNYYCYHSTERCAPCTECIHYQRRKGHLKCARRPLDCGGCLNGYEEEILSNDKIRDMCVPSKSSSALVATSNLSSAQVLTGWPMVTLLGALATIGCAALITYQYKGTNRLSGEPPPYEEMQPQRHDARPLPEPGPTASPQENNLNSQAAHQQAVPYHPSAYERDRQENQQLLANASSINFSPTAPPLENETEDDSVDEEDGVLSDDTIPSNWTPGCSNYGNTLEERANKSDDEQTGRTPSPSSSSTLSANSILEEHDSDSLTSGELSIPQNLPRLRRSRSFPDDEVCEESCRKRLCVPSGGETTSDEGGQSDRSIVARSEEQRLERQSGISPSEEEAETASGSTENTDHCDRSVKH